MSTEILLSLRSLSSFFFSDRAFSESFRGESLTDSLESLWRLFLELDPFNNEGRPKLNMDDFL